MKIWRRDPNTQTVHEQRIDKPLQLSHPIVIYLPGVTTTDDLPKSLDDTGPQFRAFLNAIEPRVDIHHLLGGSLDQKVRGNIGIIDHLLGYPKGQNASVETACVSYADSEAITSEMHAEKRDPHCAFSDEAMQLTECILLPHLAYDYAVKKKGEWRVENYRRQKIPGYSHPFRSRYHLHRTKCRNLPAY